ncbi:MULTISPECIES: acyl-CoA thioesterase [Oceanisphaera]|uniref:Acyl-CoA thioesterase n=1 Tax=Oceanisphaera ostreae TaxID=914151 RepID=A0ABW3KGD6_9GAMM
MAPSKQHFPVSLDIPVAWGDMDALQHVNNVVYFRYFETIRIEYLRRIGMLEILAAEQISPVLAETSARYRRAVVFPDTLVLEGRVSEFFDHGFTMEYQITSKQQQAVTTQGTARIVMLNMVTGEKAALSKRLKQQMVQLEEIT